MKSIYDPAEQDALTQYKKLRETLRPNGVLPRSTLKARRRIEDLRMLKEVGLQADCNLD